MPMLWLAFRKLIQQQGWRDWLESAIHGVNMRAREALYNEFIGKTEWNGDWSSKSSLWKTVKDIKLRRQLLDTELNGEYWFVWILSTFISRFQDGLLGLCTFLQEHWSLLPGTWIDGREWKWSPVYSSIEGLFWLCLRKWSLEFSLEHKRRRLPKGCLKG